MVIYSLDDMGREITVDVNPNQEPAPKSIPSRNKTKR